MGLRRTSRRAHLGADSGGRSHTRPRSILQKSTSHSFDFESSSKAVKQTRVTSWQLQGAIIGVRATSTKIVQPQQEISGCGTPRLSTKVVGTE